MLSIQKTESQKEKDRLENPPEKVEELQEELELEKNKKEIISSLYNDWIYEYNVKEKKVTTISGSSSHYKPISEESQGQRYLLLEDLHPDDRKAFVECCRGLGDSNTAGYMEARVIMGEDYHWISLTTRALKNRAGEMVSIIGKISDINDKKQEELRLQARAMQDSMTGLLNRSAFHEQAEKLIEVAAKGTGRIPAMLIVDIDKFKQINDKYGHLYGDTVIVSMADALRNVFGDEAVIGRFGGDEFTVLFLHTDKDALEDTILKLRETYARDSAETEDGKKIYTTGKKDANGNILYTLNMTDDRGNLIYYTGKEVNGKLELDRTNAVPDYTTNENSTLNTNSRYTSTSTVKYDAPDIKDKASDIKKSFMT